MTADKERQGATRAEAPLPGEMDALEEAEAEFAERRTHRLDDLLRRPGALEA